MRIINCLKGMSFVLFAALLASCERDEKGIPQPVPEPTEAITSTVSMGSGYESQIFFDIETNTVVSHNLKADWDLGFEASADGYHVILNTSKSMFAYDLKTNNFAITDTTGKSKLLYDVSSGNLDSTAIGDWRTNHNVFFIDRGYDASANHQGYKKVQILNVTADSFEIKIASLNGADEIHKTIAKDSNYNFVFLSMTTGNLVSVEPPKATWDIAFTQYTYIFTEPEFMPYLVTGCLLNRYNTTGAKDTVTSFKTMDLATAQNATLTKAIDVIGYDWKTYAGDKYTTNTAWTYIIKNRSGDYYKMHFLNFYNTSGEKGNPSFEIQKL